MKKTALLTVLLSGVMLLLCGCLTPSQKARLEEFAEEAAVYYEEKYGTTVTVTDYGYCYESTSVFSERTDHMYAECSDGTVIIYDHTQDIIADNKQSEQIHDAINAAFCADMDALAQQIGDARIVTGSCWSSYYSGDFDGYFHHAYYNGNIEDFIKDEDIPLRANISLVCEREGAWKEAEAAILQLLQTRYRTHHTVTLNAINDRCYRFNDYYHVSYEGCFAVLEIAADGVERRIQKFIKVADSVYVTANARNFVFEDGDITLVRADLTEEDVNQLILDNYRALPETAEDKKTATQENQDYATIFANTPIYQLQFSDRVKAQFPDGVDVFLRYEPYELDVPLTNEVYCFTIGAEPLYSCKQISDSLEYTTSVYHITEEHYFFVGFQSICHNDPEDPDSSATDI